MVPEVLLPTVPSLLVARNSPLIHRDLSWMQFNDRVLAQARSNNNPLLERVKFLAITSSNLDEFFMIRFSALNRSVQVAERNDPKLAPQLLRIRDNLLASFPKFIARQKEALQNLTTELAVHKIHIVRAPAKDSEAFKIGEKVFSDQVFPVLTPPLNFSISMPSTLENLQMGVIVDNNLWLDVPKSLPPVYVAAPDSKSAERYVFFWMI